MQKIIFLILIMLVGVSCQANAQKMKIKVSVGSKEFTATLNDSESSREFVKMLPLSINMFEHNRIEKTASLSKSISGRSTNPGTIQAGDIMIWSSRSLALFYSTHRTSYSYIKLGEIDNTSGLREALGNGSIEVKYEVLKQKEEEIIE